MHLISFSFFWNFQTLWDTKAFYTFDFSKLLKRFRSRPRGDLDFSSLLWRIKVYIVFREMMYRSSIDKCSTGNCSVHALLPLMPQSWNLVLKEIQHFRANVYKALAALCLFIFPTTWVNQPSPLCSTHFLKFLVCACECMCAQAL